jgi:hypothetical protein
VKEREENTFEGKRERMKVLNVFLHLYYPPILPMG